jgi:hypothetical protein
VAPQRSAIALACLFGLAFAQVVEAAPSFGPPILWAWERHEDFTFLSPGEAVVAPVVVSIQLEGNLARVRWRPQRLTLPDGISVLPVVHVDANSHRDPPILNEHQRIAVRDSLALVHKRFPGVPVQLDFEVKRSQRAFYRQLVSETKALDRRMRLSVTALASWCVGDPWLSDLPVDEIVPMVFRMGRDSGRIRDYLQHDGRLPGRGCNTALGVSLDEWIPPAPKVSHIYAFSPKPWDRNRFDQLMSTTQ